MDAEMMQFFVSEVRQIEEQLKTQVQILIDSKMTDTKGFETFGQLIDRIYGTAATMNLDIIASYCKALKDVSYMCSQSDSEQGKVKVMRMLIECLKHVDGICISIQNPEEMSKIRHSLNLEIAKAERLNKAEFFHITKKSCD